MPNPYDKMEFILGPRRKHHGLHMNQFRKEELDSYLLSVKNSMQDIPTTELVSHLAIFSHPTA